MNKLDKFVSHPIIVLVSYIFTALGFFLSLSDNKILQIIAVSIMVICIIVITVSVIKHQLNIEKEKKNFEKFYEDKFFKDAEDTVMKVSNIVRTVVDDSLSIKKDSIITDEHFRSICENICRLIASLLKSACGIEFSVCLKQICVEEVVSNKYADASTQTIARCGNHTTEREKNDFAKQPISENTSFLMILKKNDRCWASPNLEETIKILKESGNEYKNPDKDYSKYYSSTIVVPIRINAKRISNKILGHSSQNNLIGFHYIAFLCVDNLKTFSASDNEYYHEFVITFASNILV